MSVSDQLAFPQDPVPGFERLAIDVLVSLVNRAKYPASAATAVDHAPPWPNLLKKGSSMSGLETRTKRLENLMTPIYSISAGWQNVSTHTSYFGTGGEHVDSICSS